MVPPKKVAITIGVTETKAVMPVWAALPDGGVFHYPYAHEPEFHDDHHLRQVVGGSRLKNRTTPKRESEIAVSRHDLN